MRLDEKTAQVDVLTFKEGLLSAVAHDLELRVGRLSVDVADDRSRVTAVLEAGSLRVVTAMQGGRPAPALLSDGDKRKIEGSLADDVLDSRRWPQIRFESTRVEAAGDGYRVAGRLTIKDRTRDVTLSFAPEGEQLVAKVRLHQPDFGVKPFSAMLGALKVQADVEVRVRVPRPAR